MKIINTNISYVKIIESSIFGDWCNFFIEFWKNKRFKNLVMGKLIKFLQDNHSEKRVLYGLHFHTQPQNFILWNDLTLCVFFPIAQAQLSKKDANTLSMTEQGLF